MNWHYLYDILQKQVEECPSDFSTTEYRILNSDLIDFDDKTIKQHYLEYGIKEGRQYKFFDFNDEKHKPENWNNGKNLLYFSVNAPNYDESSGGYRLLQILKILKTELQYNIYFFCETFKNKKHIEILNELGIKVFVLENNLINLLKKSYINFDNAIFYSHQIANKYINLVKSVYPNIKIIVDSVDVHWIREQRGFDSGITKFSDSQEYLNTRKNIEVNTYRKADVIFTVTEEDKKNIQKEIGYNYNIKILSNIHDKKEIELGNNIFFIGGFDHQPNVDAAHLCVKIYKEFQETETFKQLEIKPKLYIVGPHLDEHTKQETSKISNAECLGKIEDLTKLYSDVCLLISPLVWGAGIKGKICHAGMASIPILTSDIGNEGIGFNHRSNALIANNVEEFVKELTYFFNLKQEERKKIGLLGQEHLSKLVSKKAAKDVLKHSLQEKHIVISIVTYNNIEKLEKCLDTIIKLTKYKNYFIHIADNSDNEDIKKLIQTKYKNCNKIVYKKNEKNEYFIKPNNEVFLKYPYSDVVLINDDVEIIEENWLNYLYSSAYSAGYIASSGGKTIYSNGLIAEAGAELYDDGNGINKGRHNDPKDPRYNIPHYTGYCSGCLLYLRRDAIDMIGVFSEELERMYYEDSEWQYRAHTKGLKTIYDHRCVAIHNEGSSSEKTGAKKYQEINKFIFLKIMSDLGYKNFSIFN